MPYHNILIIFL